MWKKDEEQNPARPQPVAPPPTRPEGRGEMATIGASITIKGELSGGEDLLIQGRLEGNISLAQHNVTVGRNGRVKADIQGHSIRIEGEVEGNLFGEEEVVIRQSGRVRGNITAPRVTLENGANFKGSIDMEPKAVEGRRARPEPPAVPGAQAEGASEEPTKKKEGQEPRTRAGQSSSRP